MDTSIAPSVEFSTFTDVQTDIVSSTEPSNLASDWVGDAITLAARYRHHIRRPRRKVVVSEPPPGPPKNEFSRYQLGEIKKVYVLPEWLTKPVYPPPPILRQNYRQPPNPLILAAQRWYQEWRNRDWDAANEFFKATDPDEQPNHPIIRVLQ